MARAEYFDIVGKTIIIRPPGAVSGAHFRCHSLRHVHGAARHDVFYLLTNAAGEVHEVEHSVLKGYNQEGYLVLPTKVVARARA